VRFAVKYGEIRRQRGNHDGSQNCPL